MNRATKYAKEVSAARLDLLTAHANIAGQTLYEKLDYQKTNTEFHAYSLELCNGHTAQFLNITA